MKARSKMKMKNLFTYAMLAFGVVAAPLAGRAATGDIYEIYPVEGSCLGPQTALQPNDTFTFVVRLLARDFNVPNPLGWNLSYIGHGSEAYDAAQNPLRLGIVVSGRLEFADILSVVPCVGDNMKAYTDVTCTYRVKSGDLALPVRLALEGSTKDNPKIAGTSDTDVAYCLQNGNLWVIRDVEGHVCSLTYCTEDRATQAGGLFPTGTDRCVDYDLSAYGRFYVQGIRFAEPWDSDTTWRSVKEGGTETSNATEIETIGEPTGSSKFYIWSEDETKVKIPESKGRKVLMKLPPDGAVEAYRWVYEIKLTAQTDYPFPIEGVAKDTSTRLVLSPVDHYVYNVAGTLCEDYLTVPVACTEPPPPYVSVRVNGERSATATPAVGARYNTSENVTTVQVSLKGTLPDHDVTVTLNPSIPSQPGKDWRDYVGLSAYNEGGAHDGQVAVTFLKSEIDAGVTTKTLYLYALGSDADTVGPNPERAICLAAEVDAASQSFYTGTFENATVYLMRTNPVITQPTFGEDFPDIQGGTTYGFELKVDDTYKNAKTATPAAGYVIYAKTGNTGSAEKKIACPTTADGTWHLNADGTLVENDGKLPVAYDTAGNYMTEIRLVSPDGQKSWYTGGTAAGPVKVNVHVSQPKTVEAVVSKKTWNEGDLVPVSFKIGPTAHSETIYAFLRPKTDAMAALVSGDFVIREGYAADGVEIAQGDTESVDSKILRLLDGKSAELLGTSLQFEVVLWKNSEYDETETEYAVDGFSVAKKLQLTVNNVVPKVSKVERTGGGSVQWKSTSDEPTMNVSVATGVPQKFTLADMSKNEPGVLDLSTMKMKWKFEEYNAEGVFSGLGGEEILQGTPALTPWTHTFKTAGYALVKVQLMDKDMEEYPGEFGDEYTFRINVTGDPSVTVAENGLTFNEADATGRVTVRLSQGANDPIEVKVTVSPYEDSDDPGRFVLDQTKLIDPAVPNEYRLVFEPGTSTAMENFLTFSDLDGTLGSQQKGFKIALKVLTTTLNPDGKPYNEYYHAEDARVFVVNEKPNVIAPASNGPLKDNEKGYIAQIGANESRAITFTIASDVKADVTAGFKVTFICTGGGGTLDGVEYTGPVTILDLASHTFVPVFSSQGAQQITLRIEDKDTNAGTEVFECTWYYDVQAAKTLRLVPHGPTGGFTTSAQSQRYANRAAMGHVWADVPNPSMKKFNLSYNCGTARSVDIYAYGYKLAKPTDDGTLDGGRDVAIDGNGNAAAAAPYYTYANADGLDSFFYRWILIQGGGESATVGAISPEHAASTVSAQGSVSLPTELGDDGAYDETVVEAVFSYEYLWSDNMGDINGDGIPDVYMTNLKWKNSFGGIFDPTTGELSGNDLLKLSGFNDDEDYLPTAEDSRFAALIPGLKETWVQAGLPFTAQLEIRGYHEGFNDAVKQSGIDGVLPDRVYDVGGAYDPEKCTISFLEHLAWMEYKTEHPAATVKDWSPERPTDPTVADTDEDGLPDGYEYYFWYRTHVGYFQIETVNNVTVTNHAYLSGERYDPANPHKGLLIRTEEIKGLYDPLVAADPTTVNTRDTDNDGLTDMLEFELGTNPFHWDTDGDGLPDGYEVMHAADLGLDPLVASSDNSQLDGERNDDKDWMAIAPYPMKRTVIGTLTKDGRVAYWHFDRMLLAATNRLATAGSDGRDVSVVDDEEEVDGWLVCTVDGRTNVTTVAEVKTVTAGGVIRLAADLLPTECWLQRLSDVKEKRERKPQQVMYKGLPTYMGRGAVLGEEPKAIKLTLQHFAFKGTDGEPMKTLASTNPAPYRAYTAWIYGRDWKEAENINPGTYGAPWYDSKGKLDRLHGTVRKPHYVHGFQADVSDKLEICVAPGDPQKGAADDLSVIHHHVYQEYEYDPRTAWGSGPNTRQYNTYDEFLMTGFFRYSTDVLATELTPTPTSPLTAIWAKYSTNPADADSDKDGLPDGWEAYLMSGPKINRLLSPFIRAGENNQGGPIGALSTYSPLVPYAGDDRDVETLKYDGEKYYFQFSSDGLNWWEEYAGVASSAAYAHCPTIAERYTEKMQKWRNKKWPTDPWACDTDGDGLFDGAEYAAPFLYGSSGTAGGGLNPLSWDTDGDGLPDPWELEFAGTYTAGKESTTESVVPNADGTATTNKVTKTEGGGWNNDGMNGTVSDASLDYDHDGLLNWQEYMTGSVRAWRYDDSCSTWGYHQYGTVQNMLYGFPNDVANLEFPVAPEDHDPENEHDWDNFWSRLLIDGRNPLFNPSIGGTQFDAAAAFFSCCKHSWDSTAYNRWYYFADGVDHDLKYPSVGYCRAVNMQHRAVQFNRYTIRYIENGVPVDDPILQQGGMSFIGRVQMDSMYVYPLKYISCDPRKPDSDHDGMDDYYEVYHGLNPLLGATAMPDVGDMPCDLVFEAYNPGGAATWWGFQPGAAIFNAEMNFWLNPDAPQLRQQWSKAGSTYDFTVYPWLAGLQGADPDGDNIRNREESIMPGLQAQSTWHHTDPSALWMTDSTYGNSLTRRYYRMPTTDPGDQIYTQIWDPEFVPLFWSDLNENGIKDDFEIFDLRDFPYLTWIPANPPAFTPAIIIFNGVDLNRWGLARQLDWIGFPMSGQIVQWMFSFEEDEGYDSDHDYLSDYTEAQARSRQASDPQDTDDPRRRQAMYLDGKTSFLQTPILKAEPPPAQQISANFSMLDMPFLYYTVECWAKPDGDGLVGPDGQPKQDLQAIVERAISVGSSNAGDMRTIRKNFLLGIQGGKWYTKYDSSGTDLSLPVEVFGPEATTNWTHLAATYDGEALRLFVDGNLYRSVSSKVQPEHGTAMLAVTPFGTLQATTPADLISLLVGADAVTDAALAFDRVLRYPNPMQTPPVVGMDYRSLYKGYVDEVRVWDGAREQSEILADYRKRYTREDALGNRDRVFNSLCAGMTREPTSPGKLPAELKYHFTFDHLPGATQTSWVEKAPSGFSTAAKYDDARAILTRPPNWISPWLVCGPNSSVYSDRAWTPWVINTVYHLPYYDGSTGDSMYWSQYLAGNQTAAEFGLSSFDFPLNGETSSRRTNVAFGGDEPGASTGLPTYYNNVKEKGGELLCNKMAFTWRHRYSMGMDMMPMGNAYPKRISAEEGGMWDEQGPADAWAETGADVNGDGLPEWWLTYARIHYGSNLKPREIITRTTVVDYYGLPMPAWQAYLRDLAEGMLPDTKYYDKFRNVLDIDDDGLPDWWEELYSVQGFSKADADADPDNDGLSNYAEYLLSEVYPDKTLGYNLLEDYGLERFVLDPTLAFSLGQKVPDYFLRYTNRFVNVKNPAGRSAFYLNEYFGEIATDHDFMEDWWENGRPVAYVNSRIYDPLDDKDEDGWSNWAECRAYIWGGANVSEVIDRWYDTANQSQCYPKPAIGLRVAYNGAAGDQAGEAAGKNLVVRTSTGRARIDATFVVSGSDELQGDAGVNQSFRLIGSYYEGAQVLHGFLNPGCVLPLDISLIAAPISTGGIYRWRVEDEAAGGLIRSGTYEEYLMDRDSYGDEKVKLMDANLEWDEGNPLAKAYASDENATKGVFKTPDSGIEVGTFDYRTGEFAIDFNQLHALNADAVEGAVFKIGYSFMIGQNWPQTLWLSEPTTGRVREGVNTIEAFLDMNGNGAFDEGEPFGSVRNVQVGWHKVPEVVIELKDESPIMPAVALGAAEGKNGQQAAEGEGQQPAALTMTVRVVRESINGLTVRKHPRLKERTLLTKDIVLADRPYVAETDVSSAAKPDLDWTWLLKDAEKLGLSANDIVSAGYRVDEVRKLADGVVTNIPLAAFSKEFPLVRPVAAAVAPVDGAPVYSAAPTLTFSASDAKATGYRLQLRARGADQPLYDSGVTILPGRTGATVGAPVFEVTPPVYAGAPVTAGVTTNRAVFADGANYQWRVALYDAKYNATTDDGDASAEWSKWASFEMDVGNENRYPKQPTGYGNATLAVRYYGPNTNDLAGAIVVEAFENADFRGQPLAQLRVTNVTDLASVTDITTPNAVLRGLKPGQAFFRAYVDQNDNGSRDKWESWGYANMVGQGFRTIYNPNPLEITASAADWAVGKKADRVIYIEDCDANKNETPDCLEPELFPEGGDEEGPEFVDWWEWAEADPEDYAEGDVMAFREIRMRLVTVVSNGITRLYLQPLTNAVPVAGNSAAGEELWSYYMYGETVYGLGTNIVEDLTGWKIYKGDAVHPSVSEVPVLLVHRQVYDAFGFCIDTAVPWGETDTRPFTAQDKYWVLRYLEATGQLPAGAVNPYPDKYAGFADYVMKSGSTALYEKWTLKPGEIDMDHDGIADGWELYVGANPLDFSDREEELDTDGLKLWEEYNRGGLPTDPRNDYSMYDALSGYGILLPGTAKFDDSVARHFPFTAATAGEDGDLDLISNLDEMRAYYRDPTALADLCISNAWSNGSTSDYFRVCGDSYLGALFNGAEFIEPSARTAMDIVTFARMGTRDFRKSGWDAWSTARYSILNAEETLDIDGVVSDELMLLIRYWNIIRPGEFKGTTVAEALEFFHTAWKGVQRTLDAEGNVLAESTTMSLDLDADAAQTTTQVMAFFGGQRKIEEVIARNKKDITADQVVTPEPSVNLVLKYAGNESCDLVLEAYQLNPTYPEYGEQMTAQWTLPVTFDAGVAKVNEIQTPALGSLKQGPARFVAYIDTDGNGKLSAGDTSGTATVEVGYLGAAVSIALGETNPGLPALLLTDGSNTYSTVALVRSAVNGKPLYNNAKGVFVVQFPNNAAREALYPDAYDTGSYIGIDPMLSSLENIDEVESVTYEVLRLRADEVATLSVTNLNNYILATTVETNGTTETVSTVVSRTVNETVTFNYSLERDVAKSIACAGSTADDFTFTFTVPTNTVNTKFWLNVQTNGAANATLFGDEKGFILKGARDGVVVLDKAWFAANRITIPTGPVKFGVVLGNDKFGRPSPATCAMAEAVINEGASFEGRLAVAVRHPTAALGAKLTVAAYESADLANPVAVTNGCAAGETVELTGLRPGASYYVAAWYVNDKTDGRGSASRRMPYDTWGYLTLLGEVESGFDAKSVKAELTPSATNTVWLQDTDFNGNNVIDREEDFKAIDGDYPRSVDPLYGFDIAGVDEAEVFSDAAENDVFAYAEVPFYCVMTEVGGAETWFAVTDPKADATSNETTPYVPVGTSLSNLTSLCATYLYDYGKSNAKRLALGTNVVWTGAEKVMKVVEQKALILVHAQVYDRFGFNPNTANGRIARAEWVNTRSFTSADKAYVTNYLANALGWTGDVTRYALPIDYPDADEVADGRGDGVLDGWELYVMFGPKGAGRGPVAHSPWNFADRSFDADGDGLVQLHEYDGGYCPTDPWSVDTDRDGVIDAYAYRYHLKGGDAGRDFDGDGLSNYAEYLVSEVFRYAQLDPDDPKTDGYCVDYFRKMGDLYLGEIFTDHDQVDDVWEQAHPEFGANRYMFDPYKDTDGNGWDNFSEFMAETSGHGNVHVGDVTNVVDGVGVVTPVYAYIGHPTPAIELTLRFDRTLFAGAASNVSVRVEAYRDLIAPDAVWNVGLPKADIGNGVSKITLRIADEGCVRQGLNTFMCYVTDGAEKTAGGSEPTKDADSGMFAPGNPFGVVRDVDVGWDGAKVEIGLTETSAITPRIHLWEDYESDRVSSINEALIATAMHDPLIKVKYGTNVALYAAYENYYSNRVNLVRGPDNGERTHVRVVRYGIDSTFCYAAGVYGDQYEQRTVLDKVFDPDGRNFLCEADFLGDGEFDIDWTHLRDEVVNASGVATMSLEVSNMTYLVVIGDGPTSFRGRADTNTTVNALATMVTRRFEVTRHMPVAENVEAIVHGARPTFRWSIPDEEPWAKAFGSSYTAFKLQILAEDGKTVVYDSGVRRAPDQDRNGVFTWTADVFAGDQTALGKVFGAAGNWKWRVAMYNAKFKPLASRDEKWSNLVSFSTSVDTQQETDDNNYSSIDLSVKYTGPVAVLGTCEDLTKTDGKVRIQAFTTADFSGEPVAQGFVTNKTALTDVTDVRANGRLIGLSFGTYYIRAYIDSNGNFRKDDWESWCAAKDAVVVRPNQLAPIVGLYIEDADTDQDWLPDAWEMIMYGSLGIKGSSVDSEGKIILKKEIYDGVVAGQANISRFLSGATLTFFENFEAAGLLLPDMGVPAASTIDAIRRAVEKNIDPDSVKITSLVVDAGNGTNGKVILTVGAKATDSIAGHLFAPVYELASPQTVQVQVYRKENLATAGWGDPVMTVPVTVSSSMEERIEVPLAGVDFNSGFYKVEIKE